MSSVGTHGLRGRVGTWESIDRCASSFSLNLLTVTQTQNNTSFILKGLSNEDPAVINARLCYGNTLKYTINIGLSNSIISIFNIENEKEKIGLS